MNELVRIEDELLASGVKIFPNGLQFPENLPMAAWVHFGRGLHAWDDKLRWWIADWGAFGEHAYGQLKAFASVNDIAPQTLTNWSCMARSITINRRRLDVPFSKHLEVSSQKPTDQNRLLKRIAEEKLSHADIREVIRGRVAERDGKQPDGSTWEVPERWIQAIVRWMTRKPSEFWTADRKTVWRGWFRPLLAVHDKLLSD